MVPPNQLDRSPDFTDWFDEVLKELTQLGHTRPLTEEEYELITNIWDHFHMSPTEAAQLFIKMLPAQLIPSLPGPLMDSLQEPTLQAYRVELRRKLDALPQDAPEFAALYAELKKVTQLIPAAREADRLVLQQVTSKANCSKNKDESSPTDSNR